MTPLTRSCARVMPRACLMAVGFLVTSRADAASRVTLRAEARVAGAYVALADVAEVEGEALPAVWLGRAPRGGEVVRVSAEQVRVELRKAGVAMRNVAVTGECRVRAGDDDEAPGLEAFRATVARAVERAAGEALPGAIVRCAVTEVIGAGAETDYARVTVTAVKPADGWWLGQARFHIYVNVGDTASDVWVARADVRGTRRAVVARRPLAAGHRICSSDVASGEVSALSAGSVGDAEVVIGRVLGCAVAEGEAVLETSLRPGPVVLRGEELMATSTNGRAAARRMTVALEDGRAGDVIRVKNPDSKKEFRVRVTGPGAGDVVEE